MKLAFTILQNIKGNILKAVADSNNYAEETQLIGQDRKRFNYMLIKVKGYPGDIETDLYIQINLDSDEVKRKRKAAEMWCKRRGMEYVIMTID